MKKSYWIVIAIVTLSWSIAGAREWRPLQIPNGDVNTCSNCHVDPDGGKTRTAFGEAALEAIKLVDSTPVNSEAEFWSSALAAMDSDSDGVTNGEELLNPDGSWKQLTTDPGDSTTVTNPGVSDVTAIRGRETLAFALGQNSPNPFNPVTRIPIVLEGDGFVTLAVDNIAGQLVRTLSSRYMAAGNHSVTWDTKLKSGSLAAAGVYFYTLEVNGVRDTRRMVLIR